MAFVGNYSSKSSPLISSRERTNSVSSSSLFVLAIIVQMLLICLAPELTALAEKTGRRLKLNLGVAALAFILATYACFWVQFGSLMNSLGVNLTLMLLQAGSLYVACYSHKLHESDGKSVL